MIKKLSYCDTRVTRKNFANDFGGFHKLPTVNLRAFSKFVRRRTQTEPNCFMVFQLTMLKALFLVVIAPRKDDSFTQNIRIEFPCGSFTSIQSYRMVNRSHFWIWNQLSSLSVFLINFPFLSICFSSFFAFTASPYLKG